MAALLRAHGIRHLADVRSRPYSRRNPQFGREALARSLAADGIAYTHLPELGGMRAPTGSEANAGVPDAALRGYADHLASAEFADGVRALLAIAGAAPAAFMCAEADPRHCHRWLLSDVLVARGIPVRHLFGEGPTAAHVLSREARVVAGIVTYPALQRELPGLR